MKRAVEDFKDQEGAPGTLMAMHFFSARGVALEKNFLGLMRSLLYQLLRQDRPVLEHFLPHFRRKQETHKADWEWHTNELQEFMLSISSPICFYIDALDECNESERQDVVSFLENWMRHARSNDVPLKIFFSSRHFPDIDIEACDEIHPERYNGTDISTYTVQRLSRLPDQKGALILKEEIVRKAQGVFLWVVLVIGILTKIKYESVEVKRTRLRQIPPELGQLYGNVLGGMGIEERKHMYLIVQWVLFAREPLTPEELFTAMAFDHEHKYPSLETWQQSESYIDKPLQVGLIRERSGGMIEVKRRRRSPPNQHQPSKEKNPSSEEQADWSYENDLSDGQEGTLEDGREQNTSIVQFTHESAREFFLHNRDNALTLLDPASCENFVGSSHDRLARACINYLGIQELRVWYTKENSTLELHMRESGYEESASKVTPFHVSLLYDEALSSIETPGLPFASYASLYVFAHAKCAESNNIKQTHLVDLFNRNQGVVFQSWVFLYDKILGERPIITQGPRATLLYVASINNVLSCVESLLDSGKNPNTDSGGWYTFPLIGAAAQGHTKVVRLLLDHKADIEVFDCCGRTALQSASGNGQLEVVQLLLDRGAKIEAQDNDGQTALHHAVMCGEMEAVQLLLNRGTNIETQDNDGQTALHHAVMYGEMEAVQLLLNRGANIETQDNQGQMALQLAMERKNECMVHKQSGWEELVSELKANIQVLETHTKTKQNPLPLRPIPQALQD